MNGRVRGLLVLPVAAGAAVGMTLAAQAAGVARPGAARPVTLALSSASPALICPGPESLLAPSGGSTVTPTGPVTVSAAALAGTGSAVQRASLGALGSTAAFATVPLRAVPAGAVSADAPGGSATAVARRTLSGAGAVRLDVAPAPPDSDPATPVATSALQVAVSPSGDLRGLSALACPSVANRTWLIGGGTAAGERTRLVLTNPTASAALLDVVVHGRQGVVDAAAGEGLVVPAGRQVVQFVDALAPDAGPIAIEVVARTGRVAASLHHARLNGFTPGGVDAVVAAAPPARTQVVPGLDLAPPGRGAVRVAVPGVREAVVRVELLDAAGSRTPGQAVMTVPAGAVRELPLVVSEDLPAGRYTAVVEADEPVVAGAIVTRTVAGGEIAGTPQSVGKTVPPGDLAWAAATQPVRGTVVLAAPPPGVSARLVLAVPAGAGEPPAVELTEVASSGTPGAPRSLTLRAGRQLEVPLGADLGAVILRLTGGTSTVAVHGALTLEASDPAGSMISAVPLRPGPSDPAAPPSVVQDPRVGLD